MTRKTSTFFSGPLMKQTCRSNLMLAVVVLVIMCLMSTVINYAMSIMGTETTEGISEDTQEELFTYMFVLASWDQASGGNLSYEDFVSGGDREKYQAAFDMYNASVADDGEELTVEGFEAVTAEVEAAETDADVYVQQFEYVYALNGAKGCFSGDELKVDEFMEVMLASAGIAQEDLEKMQELDFTTYFNKIYFTVIGLLPIFIMVILTANSLIAAQVDKGSMAYILSTPTKRSAVVCTQAMYMVLAPLAVIIVTCVTRIISTAVIFGEVNVTRTAVLYLGMYLVTEATAGICYLCSCVFSQSQKALAAGGGITLWFFLAALLGMFGSEDMVNMGIGAETLGIFNKLTIVSLFDADAVQTIGTASVDYGFVAGMIILAATAAACYIAGAVKFCRKDLPL